MIDMKCLASSYHLPAEVSHERSWFILSIKKEITKLLSVADATVTLRVKDNPLFDNVMYKM